MVMMMMMIVIIIIVVVTSYTVRSGQQSPGVEPGDTPSRRQGTPPSPHRQCWHHKTSKDAAQCPVRCCNNDGVEFGADITSTFQCCFTSTKTIRLFSDGEPTTATSTFTQLLNSELIFAVDRDVKYQEPVSPLTCTYRSMRQTHYRAQELCESRGGGPGFPSLISLRFLWT